jgi:Terminase DNA packaging enzyme
MSNEKDDDHIGKALGLEPIEQKIDIIDKLLVESHDDSATKDFELARSNMHEMIQEGKEAMFKLAEIASSSQHPRAFEVYAKLMDTMMNANERLLDLQEKIRDIKHADSPISEKAKTVNQSIFVGSTAELSKLLNTMRKSNDEET